MVGWVDGNLRAVGHTNARKQLTGQQSTVRVDAEIQYDSPISPLMPNYPHAIGLGQGIETKLMRLLVERLVGHTRWLESERS